MKRCSGCSQDKPLEAFWKNSKRHDGRQAWCRDCQVKHMQAYRTNNKIHLRSYYQSIWAKRGLREKVWWFRRNGRPYLDPLLTLENVKKKFGVSPHCYLTGAPIDLSNRDSYSFDHIIPLSKGGTSSLANCGLATQAANYAKCDLSYDEFVTLCRQVVATADSLDNEKKTQHYQNSQRLQTDESHLPLPSSQTIGMPE
jgi:hypothetical protein